MVQYVLAQMKVAPQAELASMDLYSSGPGEMLSRTDKDWDTLLEDACDDESQRRLAEDVVGMRSSDTAYLSRATLEHLLHVRDCVAPSWEECEEMHSTKNYQINYFGPALRLES